MSDTGLIPLASAFKNNGLKFKTVLCWVKSQFTLGRGDFQNSNEKAIYGLAEGGFKDINIEETDEYQYAVYTRDGGKFRGKRNIANVWFFDKPLKSSEHPTMKPIGLCAKGVLI